MGNATSAQTPDPSTHGYHVLKVKPNSPASSAGLVSYFDFIVAINGQSLTIKTSIGQPVLFTVFSSQWNSSREVTLVPSQWGEPKDGVIGCSIRYCEYSVSYELIWHIVKVHPNSPASQAGLLVNDDYIVGCSDVLLRTQQELYVLIADRASKQAELKFFVFNVKDNDLREVSISPNSTWGGPGLIGAELGHGVLHKIPVASPPTTATKQNTTVDSPIRPPTTENIASSTTTTAEIETTSANNTDSATFMQAAATPTFTLPISRYAHTLIPIANNSTGPTTVVEKSETAISPATEFASQSAPPTDKVLREGMLSIVNVPLGTTSSTLPSTIPDDRTISNSNFVNIESTNQDVAPAIGSSTYKDQNEVHYSLVPVPHSFPDIVSQSALNNTTTHTITDSSPLMITADHPFTFQQVSEAEVLGGLLNEPAQIPAPVTDVQLEPLKMFAAPTIEQTAIPQTGSKSPIVSNVMPSFFLHTSTESDPFASIFNNIPQPSSIINPVVINSPPMNDIHSSLATDNQTTPLSLEEDAATTLAKLDITLSDKQDS